jgi:hypothetical protein
MLIPTNRVAITQTEYPKGYFVARYDAEGFVSEQRWFGTLRAAQDYAKTLNH